LPETIFTSPLEWLLACVVMVVAQLVYVVFGFGSGLIAVGCLALFIPGIQDAVVLLLLVNLPAEATVAWQARKEVRWKPILGLGIGIALGIPVGTLLLRGGDPTLVLTILGWFLIAVGVLFLRLPPGGRVQPPAWAGPPTGVVSGVLTGLFGTGGPPLIVWYHLSAGSKAAFRGSLMTIFMLKTVVRVPSYVIGGLVTAPRLWSALAVLPAVLVGAWVGHRLQVKIPEPVFRRLVAGLLAVLGAVLLIRN
jgi:uncharacterized membrane protein YfcA